MMASDANDGKGSKPDPQAAPNTNAAPSLGSRLAPQPQVRIPGAAPTAQPAATQGAEKFSFDFGKAPTAAPAITPEPLVNWQDRVANRPAAALQPAPRREPAFQQNAPATPVAAQVVRVPGRQEPSPQAPQPQPQPQAERQPQPPQAQPQPQQAQPQPQAQPQAAQPKPAEPAPGLPLTAASVPGQNFNFDFGFGSERPQAAPQPAPVAQRETPKPTQARQEPSGDQQPRRDDRPVEPEGHDAIADLIAAELDTAQQTAAAAPPQPAPAPKPTVAPVTTFRPNPAPMSPATPTRVNPMPVTQRPQQQAAPAPAPRPVPAPEPDKFVTAPVFGLGGKQTPQTASARPNPDPMDEIENLIGDAVRVELASGPKPTPTSAPSVSVQRQSPASPVVPPLNTQFAPRRTSLRELENNAAASADATIMAAASATGGEVGRFQMPLGEEPQAKRGRERAKEKPAQRAQRVGEAPRRRSVIWQLLVPAVAGTLLLAAGFGIYWYVGTVHTTGPAPVLTADTTPAKQAPAAAPKPAVDAPRSPVLDQIDGVKPPNGSEQLVSRDQAQGATPTAPTDPTTEAGLANRKVRTVTVRPDGSIVSGEDSVAGSQVLPVDRPNVPSVPGQPTADASDLLSGNPGAQPPAPAANTQSIAALNANAAGNQAPAAVPAPTPTPTAALPAPSTQLTHTPAAAAPVPMARIDRSTLPDQTASLAADPANSPVNAVTDTTQNVLHAPSPAPAAQAVKPVDLIGNLVAGRPATAAPPVAQAATANSSEAAAINAPAFVQLSSQRSEAEARSALSGVQKRYGTLFGANQPQIVRVDLGAKGIYYRVLLPATSLSDANQICSSIKSAGGDCFPQKG
ncbi:MAG: hypothetical protein JWN11_2273 [Hyphomicrobiales bacterium]|nr:hypothetical protein [Hyphomicrobiales bacterium]